MAEINVRIFAGAFTLLTIATMLLKGTGAATSGCGHVQADVMFLIDTSRSVGATNFQKMIGFAVDFTSNFNIGPTDMQVGVVLFSAFVIPQIKLSQYDSKQEVISAIAKIQYLSGSTDTDKGLKYIREQSFTAAAGDRPDVPNILILLTDGNSDDPTQTALGAKMLKDLGVEIFAVGIGNLVDRTEMEVVATDQSHVTMASDFSQLQHLQESIHASLCNRLNPCLSAPCQHGGTCDNNAGTYRCQCTSGYTGQECKDDVNECDDLQPCFNGATCTNTIGSYTCTCHPPFTGGDCSQDVDECQSNPCQNGGTCQNGFNAYRCRCPSNFSGVNCQIDVNECVSSPCRNGATCIDDVNKYRCQCANGYTGHTCDMDVDECASNPCLHGGTCHNNLNGFTCTCSPMIIGQNCETVVDKCASHPCQNGGTCTDLASDYNCTCRDMVVGKNCEIDLCADIAPNCNELYNVCVDQVKRNTICRGTCDVCSDTQLFAGQTQPTAAATDCRDILPDCGSRFGACKDRIMAETMCQKTCRVCGAVVAQFVLG